MRYRREENKVAKVAAPKIKYTLTVTGEMDFNSEFTGPYDYLSEMLRHVGSPLTLRDALLEDMARIIYDRLGTAELVQMTRFDCSPECEEQYKQARDRHNAKLKEDAEKELNALKQREASLRKRLTG